MDSAIALHALNHLCALARLLPERDPHPELHALMAEMLDSIDDRRSLPHRIVRFELRLLSDLGFGLDLGRCAVTGARADLGFVSPRTGRAVSRLAGEPYRERILVLPAFLAADGDSDGPPDREELLCGFRLTEHFLRRDVFAPRGLTLPASRAAYLGVLFPAEA